VTLRLWIKDLCVHFATLIIWEIRLQSLYLILYLLCLKISFPSLPLPPLIFSYLQALIHGFLWWWACSWLILSLKWRLQSLFLLLHSVVIDLQEAKNFIDEEDPRPTSSTWSYISCLIYLGNMDYSSSIVSLLITIFLETISQNLNPLHLWNMWYPLPRTHICNKRNINAELIKSSLNT